jgi:hypothetical protein
VVAEDGGAVRRADAGGVEEILDREPAARRRVGEPRDPDAVYDNQR